MFQVTFSLSLGLMNWCYHWYVYSEATESRGDLLYSLRPGGVVPGLRGSSPGIIRTLIRRVPDAAGGKIQFTYKAILGIALFLVDRPTECRVKKFS